MDGRLVLDGRALKDFSVPGQGGKRGLSAKAGTGTHTVELDLAPGEECGRGRAVIESTTLREWIPIGTDVRAEYLEDEKYAEHVAKHADSITHGWDMQWKEIEPQQGVFDFARADAVGDFAEENGLAMRGHPLVWRYYVPDYANSAQNTPEEVSEIMRSHIQSVVGRYRGTVDEWDVVNEPMADSGGLRNVYWRKKLGRNYLPLAFLYAHEADPDAQLFLNEFGVEVKNSKSDGLYEAARQMLAAGIPLHGIGFQFHASTEGWPDRDKMVENFRRFADLGLAIQITEADVVDESNNPNSAHRRALQADAFAAAAKACKQVVACNRFTMWGLSDKYSWLGEKKAPLPFDAKLKSKPSWGQIKDVLRPKG